MTPDELRAALVGISAADICLVQHNRRRPGPGSRGIYVSAHPPNMCFVRDDSRAEHVNPADVFTWT